MFFKSNKTRNNNKVSYGLPFNLARFFSLVSLLVVLVSSVVMAFFIGNNTTSTLLESQKDYALLLAENLNKQLFRNFITPRIFAEHDGVSLAASEQYTHLDQLVQLLVHGLHIETIRIYDDNFRVSYSTMEEEMERTDLYSYAVPQIYSNRGGHAFDVLSSIPYGFALFSFKLPEGSYLLRTTYPLTMDTSYKPILENMIGPVPISDDEVLGVIEITQDITNHYELAIRSQRLIILGFLFSCVILFILIQIMARQAERILAERVQRNLELEANLYQSERLASMGRMVASIAHEIRNPLGIIRSSSEFLLKRSSSADASAKAILEAIYDESCRLGVTVNDFLDYARPKQPKKELVDLDATLRKALVFLSGEFERLDIKVDLELPTDFFVYGDDDLLYRAFYNILVNSEQAISGAGSIAITGSFLPEEKLRIRFQDSGPGFDPERLDKPLDPFYTTKDSGTGLGLPIVQSIITGHGGTIAISNGQQGGAIIDIDLPRATGK